MGRYRSPSTSRNSTIGWFVGSSTRTPTTLTSRTLYLRRSRLGGSSFLERYTHPCPDRAPTTRPTRWFSTVPPAGERRPPVRVGAGRRSAPGRFAVGLRTGHEHQPELTDLHLVAVAESRRLDPFPVDVGAVQAAHVPDGKGAAVAVKLGVAAGDGDVVEEDVAIRMPAAGGQVVVQQEPRPGVWPAPNDQQGHPRGNRPGHPARCDVGVRPLQDVVQRTHVHRGRDVEWGELVVWARHRNTSRSA